MRYRTLGWLLAGAWIGAWPLAAHADYLSNARADLQKGDLRAAQIELRNAVRADPQNGEAHYWLGRVSFELGDPVAAEREADAASARGFDKQLTTRLLAQSLMAQNRFNDLLTRLQPGGKDANLDATILVYRGYAEIGLHQPDLAQKAFADAEREAPNAVEPLMAESRLLAERGDLDGALARIDHAIQVQPKSVEALLTKSQLLRAKGDMHGAMAVLNALIKDQPSIVQARLERASLEIALSQTKEAEADIGIVTAATPGNVQAVYLKAVIAAQAKNYKEADDDLGRIANFIPRIPRAYLLLAVVKEQLGQIEQAEDAAQRYLARAPNDLMAYKTLARIEFAKQQPQKVIDTLSKIADSGKADADTYDLLGRAYAVTGQDQQAVKALEKAQSLAPQDVGVQTRLASVRMSMGEPNAAVGDLEHTLALAPKLPAVGEELFLAALSTGDMKKAADTLEKIKAAQGDTPVVENLTGVLQLANFNIIDARKTFFDLTAAHPDFIPGQINLARVLALEGDGTGAEKVLAGVLDKHPTAQPALGMLTADYAQSNRLRDAVKLMENAHTAQPDNPQFVASLGDLYIRSGNAQKALDLAQQVKGPSALSDPILNLEAASQLALGQRDHARDTYSQLVKQDPGNIPVRTRLVGLLVDAGDYGSARDVLKAGIAANPRNYQLLLNYALIDLRATGLDAAMATADTLIAQDREFTPALALKGDIYMAANRPDDAIKAYQDALTASPSTMFLSRVVGADLRAGRQNAAQLVLTSWLEQHPKDLVAIEQAAELYIASGNMDAAAKDLQAILAEKPHDAVALNNLAWVYQQQHNPQAIDLARQAYLLAPGAQTADTLGWILTTSGKPDTGVLLLRQASAQAANDPRVQYHYAVALNDTGNRADAMKLLTAIVAVKADFTEKTQAQQLLDQLNKATDGG
ncbi:MAG TPA: XrtA/PEP-CTERM system TPR-repeat protein PrsT [Acetobacteraceae bacterium]|jgi:cellulose synthase operon protein C|nr:XrtA/PEP-CTERM system TPR-repeat protein PrsT [Acetobacteraceae bacterium]